MWPYIDFFILILKCGKLYDIIHLGEDVMSESLIVKATKKRYKYDTDNVRFSIKYFIRDFNAFYLEHKRTPLDNSKEEHPLYLRWHKYRNFNNLNEEEKEYYIKNIVDIGKISWLLQKFVNDFNAFYAKYNRFPSQNAETEEEASIYSRYRYYTNRYNCNDEELQLLKENGIIPKDNVRKAIIKFVNEYNEFVSTYKRKPRTCNIDERKLYSKISRYTKDKNLNEDEIAYIEKNMIKVSDVRESVKLFVKEYLDFVSKYNRVPSNNSNDDKENRLYHKYWFYTNALNLTEDEIKYVLDNVIYLRNIDKLGRYNRKFELKGEINEI